MKKSEIYKAAQIAVLKDETLSNEAALAVLKELMDKEDTALFIEQREEQESEAVGNG